MVTTLEEEEFACGDSNHPFFPDSRQAPVAAAHGDDLGDGNADGDEDEDDFDDLYSDVNVAPFQDESSASGPPDPVVPPATPHSLGGAAPLDPKKKATVPFLGREHRGGSGVVGDSDPDNCLLATASLAEFRSYASHSQPEEKNKLFSAREEDPQGRMILPETGVWSGDARVLSAKTRMLSGDARVWPGDARVSPTDARIWSGDDRVSPIDAKVLSGDARVWSGDARVSSGDARVSSGDARVSSVGARVWSGDMHVNPPPSRQEGLLSRPQENTHNRLQPSIPDIAREFDHNREATGTSTGWDTRADRDRDGEMDGKGRVAVAVGGSGGGVSHEKGNGGGGGGTILMVGSLHWWTTDADLEGALSRYGHFRNLKFFEERASGKSRGYCQVEFLDPSAARACKEGLDGHPFDGRPCIVTHLNHHNLRQMASGVFDRSELKELGHARRTGGGGDGNNNRGRSSLHGRGGGHGNRSQVSNMNNRLGVGGGGRVRGGGSQRYGQGGQYAHQEQMGGVGGVFHHQYELAYGPSYGGFIARGPLPPSSGMSFPPYGLPAVAPHVNPAFLGRVPPMNTMNGNSGWIDPPPPSMTAWGAVEEINPRIREGSYEDMGRANYPFGGEMNKERNRGGIDTERERVLEGEWGGGSLRHEEEDSRDWAWSWEKQREHRDRDSGRDWDGEDYGRERTRTKYKVRGYDEDQRSSMSRDDDYGKRRRMS